MLSVVGNILTLMLIWGLVTFTMYVIRIRKIVKKYKDDPNIKGVHIINGKVHVIPNEKNINQTIDMLVKEEENEKVVDTVCGKEVDKENAYHLMKDDQSHYFCSWECREKFLKE